MIVRTTFIELTKSEFANKKVATDSTNAKYKIGGVGNEFAGIPEIKYETVVKFDDNSFFAHNNYVDSKDLAYNRYIFRTVEGLDNLEPEDGAVVEYCGATNGDYDNGAYYIWEGAGVGGIGTGDGKGGWKKMRRNTKPNPSNPDQPGSDDQPTSSWIPTKWNFEVEGSDYRNEYYHGLFEYTYMAIAKNNPMGIPSGVYVFSENDGELFEAWEYNGELSKYVDNYGSTYYAPSITVGKTSVVYEGTGTTYKVVDEEYNDEESRTEYVLDDGTHIYEDYNGSSLQTDIYAELGSYGSIDRYYGIKNFISGSTRLGIITTVDGAETITPFDIRDGRTLGDWMKIGSIDSLDIEEEWDDESDPDHYGVPRYVRFSISVGDMGGVGR